MTHVLYMAWRYLAHHRLKSLILIASIALIAFIPASLRVLIRAGEVQLRARADATPLLLGAKGSPIELVLSSLYFSRDEPEILDYRDARAITDTGLAQAIPLYVRFESEGDPIVGTTLDYFERRRIEVAEGRQVSMIGECVVGAAAARRRGLRPGGHVISSPESVFDVAGVYPLRMRIAGILAPTGGPDDHAIFVDLKTAWVIDGRAHGHENLARPQASGQVLARDGAHVVANASVREYQEITPENVGSFHFHGELDAMPLTAVIAMPPDAKSKALLLGRYLSDERRQLLEPRDVVEELLGTVFSVQNLVVAALALVGVTTAALAALVFLLSLRLRRGEIETMTRIGGARSRIAAVLCVEVAGVMVAGLLVAAGLTVAVIWMGSDIAGQVLRQGSI
ncbi:MAG: ABC transporter permease [Planctomycetota bacterium]|jgi:putative ABC transport system permease protein